MNESALGPKLSCTESVSENVKKARQKKTKRKKKERQPGLIKIKKKKQKKKRRVIGKRTKAVVERNKNSKDIVTVLI